MNDGDDGVDVDSDIDPDNDIDDDAVRVELVVIMHDDDG